MSDGQVAEAFARLDEQLAAAGEPRTADELTPALAPDEVGQILAELGVAVHTSVVEWFERHNGGWVSGTNWHLVSLDQAIDSRRELRAVLGGAEQVAHWLPIMVDSVETYVVDMSTGAVLCYDLVSGLTQQAPSLHRWIEDAWAETSSPVIALATPTPAQHEVIESGHRRAVQYPQPTWWNLPTGWEVVEGLFVADDTVVVLAADGERGAVHFLSYTADGLRSAGPPLSIPGPFTWRPLVMSPNKRFAVVNNGWLLDIDNRELVPLELLADNTKRSLLSVAWSADSSCARVSYGDEINLLVEVERLAVRSMPVSAHLLDNHLLSLSPSQDELQIATLDGASSNTVRAASLGWQSMGLRASLGNGWAVFSGNSPDAGIAVVNLETGTSRLVSELPLRFELQAPDGSLYAAKLDWPTDQIYRIFDDGRDAELVGLPQAEDSQLVHGPRETPLLAHHVHLESGKLAIELLNIETGDAAVLPLRASTQTDLYYDLQIAPSAVIFDDLNEQGSIEPFAAEVLPDGQFGQVRPLGDGTSLRARCCLSADATTAVWPDAAGLSWSAISGGPVNRYDGSTQLQWKPDPAKKYVTSDGRVLIREAVRVGVAEKIATVRSSGVSPSR